MAQTIGSLDLASLKNLRDDVTQYFWFESDSSSAWGSGAHVTLYPESQFTNPSHANYMKGQNIIMNTDGFSIRNGGLPMMALDNDSLDFNAVDTTNQTYTNVATFGATSRIGKEASSHINITSGGLYLYNNVNLVSYFTNSSFKVANMFSNGMVWSAYATGNINWDSDYTPFLLTQFKQTDIEGIIYYIPKTVSSTLTSGGSLDVDLLSLKNAGLLWESMVTRAYTGARVRYAWDSNGNQIEYPEGFTYSFTNTSSICKLTISYTNSSGSSALNTLTKLFLQIPSYQQYPCLMVGGYADTSGWKDASTSGGSIGNSQWAPYPFIVGNGITKQVYDEEDNPDGFEYNPSNALTVDWDGNVNAAGSIISDANYEDAWHDSTQGYTVSGVSLAGSTYLGQAIRLEKVSATKKHPIFNGFDISGTGTARIHTLAHYIYKATYNGEQYWYAYIKMRNDNTSAINNFDVTAYIAWI